MFLGGPDFELSVGQAAITEFGLVDLGEWFRYFTAAYGIAGALLLLLWLRTTFYGSVLMAAVSIGALLTQLEPMLGDAIHAIVLATIFLAIAWSYRDQLITRTLRPVPES